MSTGKVVQVIGPVVDVEFSLNDKLPDINNALIIQKDNDDTLTVEVSLELGDGVVRTVAMDGTDAYAGECRLKTLVLQLRFPLVKRR